MLGHRYYAPHYFGAHYWGPAAGTALIGRKSRHYKRRLYEFYEYSPESLAGNPEVLTALVADLRSSHGALVRDLLRPFTDGARIDTEALRAHVEVIKALRKVYIEELDERYVDELLLL